MRIELQIYFAKKNTRRSIEAPPKKKNKLNRKGD